MHNMYGNHHTSHPNGYQNSEIGTSNYPYFASNNLHHHLHMHQQQNAFSVAYAAQVLPNNPTTSLAHNSSVHQNHVYSTNPALSHLYSPTAIEYGIHTTPPSSQSPNDQFYENENVYYNQVITAGSGSSNHNTTDGTTPSETHIISSDNGLSYTNLDYVAYHQAQQQFSQANDGKSSIQQHPFVDDVETSNSQNVNYHGSTAPWQYNHLESSESSANQMNNCNSSLQTQLNNRIMSSNNNAGTLSAQQLSPNSMPHQKQASQNVPQYKWMQVKRNVPKPQCKFQFSL